MFGWKNRKKEGKMETPGAFEEIFTKHAEQLWEKTFFRLFLVSDFFRRLQTNNFESTRRLHLSAFDKKKPIFSHNGNCR